MKLRSPRFTVSFFLSATDHLVVESLAESRSCEDKERPSSLVRDSKLGKSTASAGRGPRSAESCLESIRSRNELALTRGTGWRSIS